jgi:hypothetical protein
MSIVSFYNPIHALLLFSLGLIFVLTALDDENAFTDFTNFGPDKDAKFIHMKLDTWTKVGIVYVISFFISLLQTYYNTVVARDFITSRLINPAHKDTLVVTKKGAYAIVLAHPIISWLLGIINFFVTLTMKLQFLLPQLLGTLLIKYPYYFKKVDSNTYKTKNK